MVTNLRAQPSFYLKTAEISGHNSVTVSRLEFRWNLWISKKALSACSRENARYDRLIVAAPCSKRKRLVTKDDKKGAWKRLRVFIPRTRQFTYFLKVVWRWDDAYDELCCSWKCWADWQSFLLAASICSNPLRNLRGFAFKTRCRIYEWNLKLAFFCFILCFLFEKHIECS